MTKFNLSPSLIARYFYHDCERYLRYHATPLSDRASFGIPAIDVEQSPVTRALMEAGVQWEEDVIQTQLVGRVRIPEGNGTPLSERSFSVEESVNILPQLLPGEAVYQATLPVTDPFLRKYDLDPTLFHFSPCRPDIIQLSTDPAETSVLQIIDVKASKTLKSSHRTQVTLYAMILDAFLAEHNVEIPVDHSTGGIWLYGQSEPEMFNLHLNTRLIENFLRYKLPGIFKSPLEKVSWHLYHRCEYCEFYDHCRHEAETSRSISLIPFLSVGGCRYLNTVVQDGHTPCTTLIDLETFLQRPESDSILNRCGSLCERGDALRAAVAALQGDDVVPYGRVSLSLPKNEDIGIIITIQEDPVSGEIYAAGFRRFKGTIVFDSPSYEKIYVAQKTDECTQVRRDFIRSLSRELETLNDFNCGKNWIDQKSLQTYVYDSYELWLFNQLLVDSLDDPEVSHLALRLRFYYQDPSLYEAQTHPSKRVPFPLIVLTQEIARLLALPNPFSLRLPEVTRTLNSSQFTYSINPSNLFWSPQSNSMKSDAIFMAWSGKRPEAVQWIQNELSRRLLATSSVLDGLRERSDAGLISWASKFQIPSAKDYLFPEISQMIFLTRYESYMGVQRIRELRSQPWETRVRDGVSIPLQYRGGTLWRLMTPIDINLFDQIRTLSYLLVPVGEAGERAQMAFDDYNYRTELKKPGKSSVCFALIEQKFTDQRSGLVTGLMMDIYYNEEQKPFEEGDKAVLHPRFTDFTSNKIIFRLQGLDGQTNNPFIVLIQNPHRFAIPICEQKPVLDSAERLKHTAGFTPSQQKAFDQMVHNRLTLVWGPPGTGKTYFLAKSILALIRAKRESGQRIRIGVTAFTHAAIENLLVKIHGCMEEFGLEDSILIKKIKQVRTAKATGVLEAIDIEKIPSILDEPALVLGGTVYDYNKIQHSMSSFDVLIVDEASQMKPGELALVMAIMYPLGRLVLAGDDLQLPPLLQAVYPVPEDGLPGLEGSIFAYLRSRDSKEHPRYTCQLLENWRMNSTLSRFPAETLYGSGYAPANAEIATQFLSLLPPPSLSATPEEQEFLEWILDPSYPLVLCILEDLQTTAKNEQEAEIVAKISEVLRERSIDRNTGERYQDTEDGDALFWKQGLFIVSPHHAQIGSIQTHLGRLRSWQSRPFVDTVDKMQGQESETVIVSYGVSDGETALNEAEFIYSLNRLNVSITRAKSKCIVFLPRPLLEPPVDLMQNTKAEEGLRYMLDLQEFCRQQGETRTIDIDWISGEEKIRVSVFRAHVEPSPMHATPIPCPSEKVMHPLCQHPGVIPSSLVVSERPTVDEHCVSIPSTIELLAGSTHARKWIEQLKLQKMKQNGESAMIDTPDDVRDEVLLGEMYRVQEYIEELKKEEARIQKLYDLLMKRVETKHINEQGSFRLDTKITRRRKILANRFYERYPDLFVELASIPVTQAESHVGKAALEDLVRFEESVKKAIIQVGKR